MRNMCSEGSMKLAPENIAVGCSSTQLTFSLMHIMLSQGKKLSLPDPTYCNFPSQVSTLEGVRIMRFPLLDVDRWRFVAGERIDAFGAFIWDELNHASIIDGIRLGKAQRYRYRNNNLADLEAKLNETVAARFRLIATDGVFSMDGHIANLAGICGLAEKHKALVMVDDSHAVGFVGRLGRGTHEHHDVVGRVDVLTGTLGKALGGASGGYVSGRKEIIAWLRQRSRPYLFSNTLAPAIAAGTLKALELLSSSTALRDKLETNTHFFRDGLSKLGLHILPGKHPIVPIMVGDATLASRFADAMLAKGVYVIGFSYPVVPQGKARIRVQVSAAHSQEDLQRALHAFAEVKRDLSL